MKFILALLTAFDSENTHSWWSVNLFGLTVLLDSEWHIVQFGNSIDGPLWKLVSCPLEFVSRIVLAYEIKWDGDSNRCLANYSPV